MSYMVEELADNIRCGTFSLFPKDEVTLGFSCRTGGKSTGRFSSLNMGLHVGDDRETVFENRRLFLKALALDAESLVTPEQVHGDRIYCVTEKDAGRGAHFYEEAVKGTDALVTNVRGLPLLLCYADCVPIVFYDAQHHAIGVAHGGWKGTVKHIAAKTVQVMAETFGTKPEKLVAGIGPSIGPCCYEVGETVAAAFHEAFPKVKNIVRNVGGKPHVNLWEANARQLVEAGVLASSIERAETCTSCNHARYYSYRADGKETGRLAAVLALKP